MTASTWRGKGIVVLALAAAMMAPSAPASAADSSRSRSTSDEQKIEKLSQQIELMQKQQAELMEQLKELKQQVTVKAPAAEASASTTAAAAAPAAAASPVAQQTIGEHVGAIESDLAQTKGDLQKNLGVSIHGLVDAGYEHNFNQPVHETNNLRVFDNNNGFQLTQGNLHIEKDGGVGFVTDINVGQVAETLNASTHFSNAPFDAGTGRFIDPTQYYLTYTVPVGSGINLQAGRFVTLLGEEVIPTYTNQNYNETRDFIFGFGIPFTHTGVRASYTFNDYISATGGLNNGWDDPGNFNNGGPNYEGELVLNNKTKSIALALNGIYGPNLPGKSNSYLGAIDPVLTLKPSFMPAVTLATEYDYASEKGPVINGHSATWWGVAQYLVYDWTQWESATRGEIFDDEDGSRTGAHQTLWEVTQTFSYKVPEVSGLVARFEYRHDNSNHHVFSNNNFLSPVTGAQHLWKGQDTLLGSMIYAF